MEILSNYADKLKNANWLDHSDWINKFKDSHWKEAFADSHGTLPVDPTPVTDPTTGTDTPTVDPVPADPVDTSPVTEPTPVTDPTTGADTPTVDPVPADPVDTSPVTEPTPVTDPTTGADTPTVDPVPAQPVDTSPVIEPTPVTDPTTDAGTPTVDPAPADPVDTSPVTDPAPVTDPTTGAGTPTVDPAPADPVDGSTQPAPGLTYTTTPVHSEYDGQVIENLDIYVKSGDAVTITHDNVILRNCRIHHVDGDGVSVSGATGVRIENSEVINADPPTGTDAETSADIINIKAENAPDLTVQNTTVREGSTGIYLVNSPGAELSHVDGYDFHGPFPRGQFVQFNNSGNSSLTDFYAVNHADSSHPEDIVSVYGSPNTTISNGVIDGNNSQTGVGVMFENGSTGGRVVNVDAIHQANGAFSSYVGDVTFDDTRSFDGINEDQGRGLPSSNGLIWNVSSGGVSILNSTYTNPGNPDNIVWDSSKAVVADVHEDPNATPMAHIDNQFAWDYAA